MQRSLNLKETQSENRASGTMVQKPLDKYNPSKCVHELMCRTQIQQQFMSGWKPVDGSELPQKWIDLDNSSSLSNCKGEKRKYTKFLS